MIVSEYLKQQNVKELTNGKSGADVYLIDDEYILKHVLRNKIEDSVYSMYVREAMFYQCKKEQDKEYLPDVTYSVFSDDEIIILMKKYAQPDRNKLYKEVIDNIVKAIVLVHTDDIPEFLTHECEGMSVLTDAEIKEASDGWLSILGEHPGEFDPSLLEEVASQINDIITWHNSEEKVLLHGDFHWDNLLMNEDGDILLCDWQSVKVGGVSEDLSFFLSRLSADGTSIDEDYYLDSYAEAYKKESGRDIQVDSIRKHMKASNVITTFRFWHRFLHGCDSDTVRDIYEKLREI